jgi:fructose transport system ATP-binding protein
MQAKGLVKRYGQVTALDGADFELRAGEILAVIGDNGAGKSSLIKALSGATVPDEGEILLDGQRIQFKSPIDARRGHRDRLPGPAGPGHDHCREPVPRPRAAPPRLCGSALRMLDKKKMLEESVARMAELKVGIRSMTQAVETLGRPAPVRGRGAPQRSRATWSSWTSPPRPWA